MEKANNQLLKNLKKVIGKRILTKYLLFFLLILFTCITIFGAICQETIAIWGYGGMILIMLLMAKYPTKLFNKRVMSQKDYETVLELLCSCNEMNNFFFIETLYALMPEITILLYKDEEKEEFYRANLALIQSVYKNKKEEVLKCPLKFSEMCKYLYSEYKGKNENLNKNIWEQLIVSEIRHSKRTKIIIPENINSLASYVFLIVIFVFKLFHTINIDSYNEIGNVAWKRILYNVGPDFIAIILLVISSRNSEK